MYFYPSKQILGKKGHSLSWLTGISNPYIRVALISSADCEAVRPSSSHILNLPSKPSCKLEGISEEKLRDSLLKFVVLDFDRFSRSEFVAEVLVPLGDLGDLREGVTICEDLMLQQKVTVREIVVSGRLVHGLNLSSTRHAAAAVKWLAARETELDNSS